MMNYNALNIVGALTVLEAMGIFDINEYNTCIQKLKYQEDQKFIKEKVE